MTAPISPTGSPRTSLVRTLTATAQRALKLVRGSRADTRPTLPESPFEAWTFANATDAVEEALQNQRIDQTAREERRVQVIAGEAFYPAPRRFQDPIAVNRAFFEGDHWQDGTGWVGPHPQVGDVGYDTTMREIALAFASKNVVREVVMRHASGVAGRLPTWSFVPKREMQRDDEPTPAEAAAIAEATRLMRNWIKQRKVHKTLLDAVATALFAERAPLRLYVPPGRVDTAADGSTFIRAQTVDDALAIIWPDHPKPEHATVSEDDDTKLEAGIRLYEADVDDDDKEEDCAELTYLDQFSMTVIRHVDSGVDDGDADDDAPRITLDLGGRLTMFELHRTAIITPQVQQHQRALNLALSVIPRTIITSGFLERVILNGQMPGTWETDKDGKRTGRFIPGKFKTGSGTTNWITGVETGESEEGYVQVQSPDVKWRDPVDPQHAIAAAAAHYLAILEETRQLHAIMSGDSNASGKSREEARKEFLETLLDTEGEVEAAMRFLLEAPLAFAEALAGTPGKYSTLVRADVNCRIDLGSLTADDVTGIQSRIGKTLSTETAMSLLGVDDVSAEKAKMAQDPAALAQLRLMQGQALVQLTTAGAALVGAAKALGMDENDAKALLDGQEFEQPTPTPELPAVGGRKQFAKPGAPEPAALPAPKGDAKQTSGASNAGGG